MSAPRRLRTRFSEFVPIHLATDEGVWLRLAGAEDGHRTYCEYALHIHEEDEGYPSDDDSILALDLFLTDAGGTEWSARKFIHAVELAGHLLQDSTRAEFFYPLEEGDPTRFVRDAEREEAFQQALYLRGVQHTDDDSWSFKVFGPGGHPISFKFEMTGTFDLALKPSRRSQDEREVSRFAVRLSGIMPYAVTLGEEEQTGGLYEHHLDGQYHDAMGPVLFDIGFFDLLRAEDAVYLGEDEEAWESTRIPLPLVFRRTGEMGEPQPGVTVVKTYGA